MNASHPIVLLAFLGWLHSACAATPFLLANYTFERDGSDVASNSLAMDLRNTAITNNTLFLGTNDWVANAEITGFSYNSFTVALDFFPLSAGEVPHWNILSGGPTYRWIGFDNRDGRLVVSVNNQSGVYPFPDTRLETKQWHSLVCSVATWSPFTYVVTFLDGVRLRDIVLNNFTFDVVGTASESSDKVFSFRNYGNAATFFGYADNLRVYSRFLNPDEIMAYAVPRLNVACADDRLIVHWPATLTGYLLQSADAIQMPSHWTVVANPAVVIGDRRVVLEPMSSAAKFFRLSR